MIVTTEDGDQWPTYRILLGDWLAEKNADRYFIRWVEQAPGRQRPGRGTAATLAQRIIPDEALQYLHDGSNEIVPTLLDVITGISHGYDAHPIAKILESVRAKVEARDNAIRPQTYGKMSVGQHTEPHLLDAMRRLVKDGRWTINIRKSRLWLGEEGLFLVWPTAAKEMMQVLRDEGVAGIPNDTQTIQEILSHAGILESHHEGGHFWTIYPPGAGNELAAVKFVDEQIVLGHLLDVPEPVGYLTKKQGEPVKPETPAEPQAATGDGAEPLCGDASDASNLIVEPPEPKTAEKNARRPVRDQAHTPRKPADGEVDLSRNLSPELGKGLDDLTRDVFGALLDDIRAGKIVNQAGKVKEGYAIGLDQLASYGIDIVTFAGAVQKAGWLYTSDDKPNRKIMEVQISGKLQRAVVIRTPVAVDIGLIT